MSCDLRQGARRCVGVRMCSAGEYRTEEEDTARSHVRARTAARTRAHIRARHGGVRQQNRSSPKTRNY